MRCTAECGLVRTAIALYQVVAKHKSAPEPHMATTGVASLGVQSVQRTMDLSHAAPGWYRFEVALADERGRPIASRSVSLLLR